jgi:hypothetical protein
VDHDDDVSDDSGMFVSDATTVYSWSCHGTTWFWNEMNSERQGNGGMKKAALCHLIFQK